MVLTQVNNPSVARSIDPIIVRLNGLQLEMLSRPCMLRRWVHPIMLLENTTNSSAQSWKAGIVLFVYYEYLLGQLAWYAVFVQMTALV